MKKLTLFLAAALLAASFAACGNSGASSSTAPEPTAIPDDILNAPATKPDPDMEIDPGFGVDPEDSSAALQPEPDAELSGIVDQIYAAHPVDLMMVETTAVDLTNAEWYPYQTGLNEEQITKVDAAVISEPGVGSQAYCMVLVRLKDKANGTPQSRHLPPFQFSEMVAVDENCTAAWIDFLENQLNHGTFSRTGRSNDKRKVAVIDFQIDIVQCIDTAGIHDRDISHFHHVCYTFLSGFG